MVHIWSFFCKKLICEPKMARCWCYGSYMSRVAAQSKKKIIKNANPRQHCLAGVSQSCLRNDLLIITTSNLDAELIGMRGKWSNWLIINKVNVY